MIAVFEACTRAFRDLFQFQVLWIIIWPILAAGLVWLVIAVIFWGTFSGWIASGLAATGIEAWLQGVESSWVANTIQFIIHLFVFVPLVFATALILTALFAMPGLIRLVSGWHYPDLEYAHGGNMAGSIANALVAIGVYLLIWVVTVPLWLVGVGIIVPFIAATYLNQRLFRYDALAEHASREEIRQLLASHQSSLWGLGLLTGLIQFVPFLNLLAPVLAALAFIHFGLTSLTDLRNAVSPSPSTGQASPDLHNSGGT